LSPITKERKIRDYISPSDLSFLWDKCHKCFWLKYNKGISQPGFMPLVGPTATFQERIYQGLPTEQLDTKLPKGIVTSWGAGVESTPIVINGKATKWRIKGKYDLVITFSDGTLGIIDCKVTTSEMGEDKVDLYWPQLEAYAYALENPLEGEGTKVSESGLLMWRVIGAAGDQSAGYTFTTDKEYLSAGRRAEEFQNRVSQVIEMLEGSEPESGSDCGYCKYVIKRRTYNDEVLEIVCDINVMESMEKDPKIRRTK